MKTENGPPTTRSTSNARINASTRAAAGMFSMQHGLLPEEGFPGAPPRLSR